MAGFSAGAGLWDALSGRDDDRAYYLLDGDLCQMGTMQRWLREHGFPVVKSGVYPGFKKEDKDQYVAALKALWENRVDGWWNQKRAMVEHGVCAEDAFGRALTFECEAREAQRRAR